MLGPTDHLKCPYCGAACIRNDTEYATGDYSRDFECGSWTNDNGPEEWYQSEECKRRKGR